MKRFMASTLSLALLMAVAAPAASAQTRSRFGRKSRTAAIIGAGLGAAFGGKRAAAVGALAGAGGSYLYTKKSRRYRRRF